MQFAIVESRSWSDQVQGERAAEGDRPLQPVQVGTRVRVRRGRGGLTLDHVGHARLEFAGEADPSIGLERPRDFGGQEVAERTT